MNGLIAHVLVALSGLVAAWAITVPLHRFKELRPLTPRDVAAEVGIDVDFVQDNLSLSRSGVVRGLHYQHPETQGKLVYVLQGKVFDVDCCIPLRAQMVGQTVAGIAHRNQGIAPRHFHA